ncbi:MAG TPA: O-acetyl-ADP-ribose deacetylase [Fusobacterium sp.]|uniref:O-acetyl-ADP-ribose deacetylase n=1 Tax=Fusobacterium sp. TaxID=68766 RepID=UPI002F3F735B
MIYERGKSSISLKIADITTLECDCIVNAANKTLLGGGGVDGAIHRAAGPGLLQECYYLHGCNTGEAKITKGYQLKAKWVIHTVGPIYSGREEDSFMLQNCYWNSLNLAKEYSIHSLAFPAISTGAYGYPLREANYISLSSILKWLQENQDYEMHVILVCFNERFYEEYQKSFQKIVLE